MADNTSGNVFTLEGNPNERLVGSGGDVSIDPVVGSMWGRPPQSPPGSTGWEQISSGDDSEVTLDGVQTLENKTLIAPTINPTFYAEANEASIREQAAKATAAGGGTVIIPAGTIILSAPIVLTNGVTYKGTGWNFTGLGNYRAGIGTILKPNVVGAFNAFEFQPIDNPDLSISASPHPNTDTVAGPTIESFILDGFAYGVKVGANNRGGSVAGTYRQIFTTNCTNWGFWIENCSSGVVEDVQGYYNLQGQVMIAGSGLGYNWGNFTVQRTTAVGSAFGGGVAKTRNMVILARNGSSLNALTLSYLDGFGGSTATYSGTATITSGNPDISVPDLSKYIIGTPVVFATTTGNITAFVVYFVYARSGTTGAGTIRISSSQVFAGLDGAASARITPNASGTPLIKTRGTCGMEIVAIDNSSITYTVGTNCDIETAGSVGFLLQNTIGCYFVTGLVADPNDGFSVGFCARNSGSFGYSNSVIFGQALARVDIDTGSSGLLDQGGRHTTIVQNNIGRGIMWNPLTSLGELHLFGGGTANTWEHNSSGRVRCGVDLAYTTGFLVNGSTAMGTVTNGSVYNYTSGTGTCPLPTIGSANVGIVRVVMNSGTGTVTLTSTAGNIFNAIPGKLSIEVPVGAIAICQSGFDGSVYGWFATVTANATVGGTTVSTFANLPSASASGMQGARRMITDGATTLALGIGTAAAGGGANIVPVTSDGTTWNYG